MPVSEERRGERGLAISLSEKFYRRLLRAYPEDFKDRYGAEMALVFRDLCREELGRHGAWALAVLWARTLIETVFAVLEQRGGTLARQVSPGRWPTMPRRGGAAAIVGGLLMIFQLLGVLGSGYFLAADIQLLLMVGLLGFWALLARTEARSTTVGSRSVRPRQATVAAFLACCSAVSGVSVGTYRTWTGHAGPLSNLNETPFLVGTVGFAMLYVLFHRSGSPPATTDIENSSLRLVKVGVLLTGLATVMQLGLITYRASNSGYTVFFPEHLDPLGGPYYSYVLQNWVGWLWVAGLALIGVAVLQTRVFGKSGVFLLLVAVLGARLPLLSTPDISLSYAPIGVASVSQEWSPLLAYFMLAELPLGICWVLLGCALWSKAHYRWGRAPACPCPKHDDGGDPGYGFSDDTPETKRHRN